MTTSFYSEDELQLLGFKNLGSNVLLSRKASVYGVENIEIGNNVRIDDFCILSGKICIQNYVHIAAYTALYGGTDGIYIDDYANISARCCIYSVSDDYSGETMTNPMVPKEYKNVVSAMTHIGKNSIIGNSSTIMPGVYVNEGTACGAYSFVKEDTEPWSIYVGIPAKRMRRRKKNLIDIEQIFVGGGITEFLGTLFANSFLAKRRCSL